MSQTIQARRLALRQKIRIAQETYDGIAAEIIQIKQSGQPPPPELLAKEVAALRLVASLSQELLDLIAKG